MEYIVFDLEFNQDFTSSGSEKCVPRPCFEIIQIGAVKLDQNFEMIDIFDHFIKPTIYPVINPFITELTGITTEQLSDEKAFPEVYQDFIEFAGRNDPVYCIWGMADIKELYRNVKYHRLDQSLLSNKYINLQLYAASYLNLPLKNLPKLKTTAESLNIPLVYSFHNALHDAHYTAEIFRRLKNETIQPKIYDPDNREIRRRQIRKKTVDFSQLIQQFEKMYSRELTSEERDMIQLAYKMGKTGQFVK